MATLSGRHVWMGWGDNASICVQCGIHDFSLGGDDHGTCPGTTGSTDGDEKLRTYREHR